MYLSFIPSLELRRSFGGTKIELEAGIASRASIGCNKLERGDCAGNSQSSLNGFANARVTQDLLGIGNASIHTSAIIDNTPIDTTDNTTDQKIKVPMYSVGGDLSFGSKLVFRIGGEVFYYDLGDEVFVTSEGKELFPIYLVALYLRPQPLKFYQEKKVIQFLFSFQTLINNRELDLGKT